jgi:hypothetical protein
MSKIQTSVNVEVASLDQAREKILSNLGKWKCKLVSQNENSLTFKRGSQAKMRLLGGAFIKDSDLPVLGTVTFGQNSMNTVSILVAEHIVVGLTLGMRDKFQRACTEIAKEIVDILG